MLDQDSPQPQATAKESPDGAPGLARNQVGVLGIVFFVVAAASPLTVVVALFPVIIGSGNGVGIAGAFVLVAMVLTVFAVGYVAMSKHITNAGAFYAFITRGLGRPVGLGSASLAIFGYNAIQLGVIGGFGYYASEFVTRHTEVVIPWWVFSFLVMGASLFLGIRQIHVGTRVLAVLLTLETGIIALLNVGILFNSPTPISDYSLQPFLPSAVFAGALGVALMFAHASFIGFEGTAIYGEEAKDPKRTVPRATYGSVIFMGAFYSVTAFLIVNAVGVDNAVGLAETEGGNLVFAVSNSVLGSVGTEAFQLLIITALFAAILTFHNNVARYLFSLGRQGVLWSRLGTTHPTRRSPAIACYVQIGMVAVVVAIFAAFGLDPYATLFTWWTGVGAAAIILLQTLASIAIFVFFRRSDVDKRPWNTFIAPLLGIAGLLPFLWYAVTGMDVLLGGGGWLQISFTAMLFASLAVGIIGAYIIKARSPQRYEQLNSTLGDRV
ncbi:APC family permease [Mycolicibacterium hippocampi]|uniref:Amino acid permease n=1 Tax=Mycolicibacterium hippocampi TaxID=659824 RepID=A0A7I9ZM78_9MYCO|nr:APC family permease [Mycolicibacterium hippocampi]GFH02125.1 amino acid permease [Mycolicibacterium hippocampi]